MTVIRQQFGAMGNQSFGYFAGAWVSNSIVDRVDYSNDTATASPKGPLSVARGHQSATGNTSFGYFGGGSTSGPDRSTVERIDYSNDTATASEKGPLNADRFNLGASSAGANALPQ